MRASVCCQPKELMQAFFNNMLQSTNSFKSQIFVVIIWNNNFVLQCYKSKDESITISVVCQRLTCVHRVNMNSACCLDFQESPDYYTDFFWLEVVVNI